MKFKHLHTFLVLVMVALVTFGCRSRVDLENINKQAELDMGLAFPVGSIHATIGDFLGAGQVEQLYVDEHGIFHYMDTFDIPTKDYHKIKIEEYVLENERPQSFKIKEKVEKDEIKGGEEYVLSYDFGLSTAKFTSKDPMYERFDKIRVNVATFTSKIRVSDFNINWSELQKVQLILGDQFDRADGNTINIPIRDYAFNREIPISVDNFDLSMLDKNGQTASQIKFKIKFFIKPGSGRKISVTDDSKFSYELKVGEIDYEALWGYFESGNEMRDTARISLDSVWDGWKNISKLKVRFMEPRAQVFVVHEIAAPLKLNIDYVEAINAEGEHARASWGGAESCNFPLENRLSIDDSTIGQSVTNSKEFDHSPDNGHLDHLFDVRPDTINYGFWLSIDHSFDQTWPQHRILKDHKFRGYAVADVPFKMNTGSEIGYSTTISNINISDFSLDSILNAAEVFDSVKTSDIKLILDVKNGLPFALRGQFIFLDKDSNEMDMHFIVDNDDNYLYFPAPKMEVPAGSTYGVVVEPSSTRAIISVERNDFDRLSEIGYIQMDVAMLDNPVPCTITKDTELQIRIGIAARVDAILDFDKKDKNEQ